MCVVLPVDWRLIQEHVPQFDPHVRRLLFRIQVASAQLPPRRERGTPDLRSCQAWLTNSTPEGLERGHRCGGEGMWTLFVLFRKKGLTRG